MCRSRKYLERKEATERVGFEVQKRGLSEQLKMI